MCLPGTADPPDGLGPDRSHPPGRPAIDVPLWVLICFLLPSSQLSLVRGETIGETRRAIDATGFVWSDAPARLAARLATGKSAP